MGFHIPHYNSASHFPSRRATSPRDPVGLRRWTRPSRCFSRGRPSVCSKHGAMTQAQFLIHVPTELRELQTTNAGESGPPAYDWQRASCRDAGFPLPLTMPHLRSAATDVCRPVAKHAFCGTSPGKGFLRAVFEVSGTAKYTTVR